jgi:hypothetical protein
MAGERLPLGWMEAEEAAGPLAVDWWHQFWQEVVKRFRADDYLGLILDDTQRVYDRPEVLDQVMGEATADDEALKVGRPRHDYVKC